MDSISRLTEYFREFPGIGPRQAKRFVYFLLTKNPAYLDEISKLILEIKKSIRICSLCFRFHQGNEGLCSICNDKGRNQNILMIVSRDVDLETIEKSKFYDGYYFILGGNIPILEKEPNKKVRINELMERLNKGNFKEIIISLNANAEGDYTSHYISDLIKNKYSESNYTISTLGRGLSTGTELEYSDSDTIKNALKHRERV